MDNGDNNNDLMTPKNDVITATHVMTSTYATPPTPAVGHVVVVVLN